MCPNQTHASQQSCRPLLQVMPNFRQQLARAERLRHLVIAARRPCLLFFATEHIGGDRDDRDRSQLRIGFNPAGSCITVHDRELDIHQDEIGRLLCDCRQRLLTVFGLCNFVVGRGQHIADDLAIIRLVLNHQNALVHAVSTCCTLTPILTRTCRWKRVEGPPVPVSATIACVRRAARGGSGASLHHQNALAHAGSTCRSTMIGSVKANVEPWPGCDSTQILPPCISTMRFDMASPKPVPPFLRVMALSACWNSWNSLAWSAAEMP